MASVPDRVEVPEESPRVAQLKRALAPLRRELLDHRIYRRMDTLDDVRVFMEHHVFAVWDFMCLLKSLQRSLTCVQLPWVPRGDRLARRLINEIVLGEETDLDGDGGYASHFELYLEAMRQCGAGTAGVERFVEDLGRGTPVADALRSAGVPEPARRFVDTTWGIVGGEVHAVAGAFAFGREDLIPDMFRRLVSDLDRRFARGLSRFMHYLERHIQVDAEEHTPMAFQMLSSLCGDDDTRWREVEESAKRSLRARIALWDGVAERLGHPTPAAASPRAGEEHAMTTSGAAAPPDLEPHLRPLQDDLRRVEVCMRDSLNGDGESARAIAEHILGAGGKLLRPALVLLASEACGYKGPRRIGVAAAIELLHTATLLHDDVVDHAELRRGRPAANALWGNTRAVLVGDVLLGRAFGLVASDGSVDGYRVFSGAISAMADGQLAEIAKGFDPNIGEGDYFGVIYRKTAALIESACELAAIISDADVDLRRRLATYGHELGLAFQLRDDALDMVGTQQELGKTPGTDLREGRVTLPLLIALERCAPAERELIVSTLKAAAVAAAANDDGDIVELEPVLRLIERYDGVVDTVDRARRHAERAIDALDRDAESRAGQALVATARYVVERTH